jgi:23S rRNA pseudouridine1911/1915/1917 synthase
MTAVGHPIIGDTLYGAKTVQGVSLGMNRCALHALELSFHDYEGNFKTFKAPYPQDFAEAVEHIAEQSNI